MPNEKIELPEQEIIDYYVSHLSSTLNKLAKKYKTTTYRIRKILDAKGVLRKTKDLEILIIERMLKYERQFDKKTTHIEMLLAKKLIALYPEEEFWRTVDLGFKLNSLAFLQSVNGAPMIKSKYGKFKFEIPATAQHNMGTEKIGEDVEVVTKPKSIHDFMKR